MIRVKICGITTEQNAAAIVRAGADAIGLQFVDSSPRRISVERAIQIRKEIPPFVSVVGVFLNATREEILRTVELVGLDYVQLHGDESPDFIQQLPVRSIKTVGVSTSVDLINLDRYPADAILLDTKVDGRCGGTGQRFDWSLLREMKTSMPIVLAGGLRSENIVEAIRVARPQVVDVCTGVENAPGIKSYEKVREFIGIVRNTDPDL